MDIFIYFYTPLGQPLDVIEDALDDALEGRGEVTGTGVGSRGSNFDVEIFEEGDAEAYLREIRRVLREAGAPGEGEIVIDGATYPINPDAG